MSATGNDDLAATVAALAERVARLEDHVAIYQLMMSYGPSVDSGTSEFTASLWTDDGVYDFDNESDDLDGAAAIKAMVEGPRHQSYIHEGCAHLVSIPYLRIDGDTAVATGYSSLNHRDGDGFRIGRITANRWELTRTASGWKVTRRTNRILNGEEEPRAMFRRGLTE
jgi:ketosteroid isomerase-like protein